MGKLPAMSFLALACLAQDAPRSTGWVVIPVQEYNALRGKAMPVEPEPPGVAIAATLSRVDYELRVSNGIASGTGSLTIDVLKDGWVKVPIPSGLLVRAAHLSGNPVSLVNGAAVLSTRGRSVLTLDVALPVNVAGGEERLAVPVSGSGVTHASLTVGRADVDVKVTGGILADQTEGAWSAFGRGDEPLVFSWRQRIIEQPREAIPVRMRGSLVQLVGLGEDGSSISAEVALEVLQGAPESVKIHVPDGVTVNQVPGATVADWEVKSGELIVTFLEPVEHAVKFVVQGEVKLSRDGAMEVPLLRLEGVERESGGVAVEVLGAGEITNRKPQGLEAAEAAELGPSVVARQSPSLAAFRFKAGAQTRALNVTVARYAQRALLTAIVDDARYRVLVTREGKTLVQAHYTVRNNQRTFMKIALPAGAVLWTATQGGREVRPGKSEDGGLLFPLEKARAGEEAPVLPIELLYMARGDAWTDRGRTSLALAAVDMPVSKTGVALHYPPMYRTAIEPGPFRAQEAWSTPAGGLFPVVGPVAFVGAELTAENATPKVEITYQRTKDGGVK